VEIHNKTRGSVLSSDAALASSFLSRARGLLFSRRKDLILVSSKEDIASSSIHMVLMTYSIDVLWLDSEKKVVDIRPSVPPFNALKLSTWRIYRPRKPAVYVVELGAGSIKDTVIGDLLEFSK